MNMLLANLFAGYFLCSVCHINEIHTARWT